MAQLSIQEKETFEELFDMKGGYVLEFTNTGFARFIGDVVNIDIYARKGYQDDCAKKQIKTNME